MNLDDDEQPSDESMVLHALHVASYTLSVHGGMGAVVNGEARILNFKLLTDMLWDAMEAMGVDTSKPLHAPVPRADPDEHDDDDVP